MKFDIFNNFYIILRQVGVDIMENLNVNGTSDNNIFRYNDDLLLKYSSKSLEAWDHLMKKNMNYANLPVDIFELTEIEKNKFPNAKSKLLLPFYDNYQTFYDEKFTKDFKTKNILEMFLRHTEILKDMHNKEVYFYDLHTNNIMIDKNFDIKFIDYDLCLVDNIIDDDLKSLFNYNDSTLDIKSKIRENDKRLLLKIYLNYLYIGSFKPIKSLKLPILSLGLDNYSIDSILKYLNENNDIKQLYYLENIIDHLIQIKYEVPRLILRKYM